MYNSPLHNKYWLLGKLYLIFHIKTAHVAMVTMVMNGNDADDSSAVRSQKAAYAYT